MLALISLICCVGFWCLLVGRVVVAAVVAAAAAAVAAAVAVAAAAAGACWLVGL